MKSQWMQEKRRKRLPNVILLNKTPKTTRSRLLLPITVNQSFTEEIVSDAAIKVVEGIEIKWTKHINIDPEVTVGLPSLGVMP